MLNRRATRVLIGALALAPLLTSCGSRDGPSAAVPRLDHVVVIVMENKSAAQAVGAPFAASLVAEGSSFSQSHAVTHPSQPNYLALWAGSTLGVTTDECPAPGSPFSAGNLGQACQVAGLTWRAYSEDLPSTGSSVCSANTGLYARKHEPWTNFDNVDHQNERSLADLQADLAGGTLPTLAFVIPNACNDTHQCSLAVGDNWLRDHVPALVEAVGPRGVVILTWDEDDNYNNNQILTVFVGAVKRGYTSARSITHLTVSRTIFDALGLPASGAARLETPISDVWSTSVSARP
jgi:phosphatidylinositol-3-phosphatase